MLFPCPLQIAEYQPAKLLVLKQEKDIIQMGKL